MKRPDTRIKEIESGRIELAHPLGPRADLDAEILQLEAAQEARVEDAILEAVRRWRIARLPIGEALAVLEQLLDTQNMPVPTSESALAPAAPPSGDIEIVVKLSRNASPSNRRTLTAAGLHWHGRIGKWTGKTSAGTVENLRCAFGGRVAERTLARPAEETGLDRVDAPDGNASALDADVKAVAADVTMMAESEAVESQPNQSAATASLPVPLYSLRGFPRARPLG